MRSCTCRARGSDGDGAATRSRGERCLRGAGSIAIALPWLEIMGEPRRARAQDAAAKRRASSRVYTPGGTVQDKFWPQGGETGFTLSPILAPLAPVREQAARAAGARHEERDRRAAPGRHRRLADRHAAVGRAPRLLRRPVDRSGDRHAHRRRTRKQAQPRARGALGHGQVARAAPSDQLRQLRRQRDLQPDPAAHRSGGDLRRPVRLARSEPDERGRGAPRAQASRSSTSSAGATRRLVDAPRRRAIGRSSSST